MLVTDSQWVESLSIHAAGAIAVSGRERVYLRANDGLGKRECPGFLMGPTAHILLLGSLVGVGICPHGIITMTVLVLLFMP